MKPSLIKESLKSCVKTREPAFIWGAPGVGKSETVAQLTKELAIELNKPDFQMWDVRTLLLDPVDMRGLPTIKDGRVIWATPDFLPPEDANGILFFDELNAAPPLMQAACYQITTPPFKLGEYTLSKGVSVIAAGNRESDRAVTHRMPSALANRFTHLDYDVDHNDWAAWALENDVMTELIGFIRFRPELLHSFDPKKNEKAFPSPRSIVRTSNLLKSKPCKSVEYDLIKGTIGEGAAAELIGFLDIFRSLPNPDSILLNPSGSDVPTDAATLYALCGALAKKASEQNFNRLCEYAARIPAEFSVLMVRDCLKNDPDIANTKAFIQWSSDNADVLM